MLKGSRMRNFVLILLVVMVASFAIAGIIFVGEYGTNNFSILKDDLRPAGAVDVNVEKTASLSNIDKIIVNTASDNINFIPSDASEIKAHFYGYYKSSNKEYKPELTIASSGGELAIKIAYKPHIAVFRFTSNLKLDVYLPRSYMKNLEANTASADVKIDEMNVESLICKTASGDLTAGNVKAKTAEFGTFSGNIRLSTASDDLWLHSTSGDITADRISTQNCRVNTTSGNITADGISVKTCQVDTTSGSITLKGISGNMDATSTSGEISLQYAEFANNINVQTASGSTEIKLPQSAEFHLKYSTASGSGKCDFPITMSGTEGRNGSLDGTVVSDRNSITVNSSSGSLNIYKN